MRDFWCPKCRKKGLHPYNKSGSRPIEVDDIDHMWCLYCNFRITSNKKKDVSVGEDEA